MATISSSHNHQSSNNRRGGSHHHRHGPVVEEIDGLIKVFNDGCVERPPIVPTVSPTLHPSTKATAFDVKLSNDTSTRVYIPDAAASPSVALPLLVYFHGGGFCVGSAAWSCYHDFLTSLAVKARCVVVSVNYCLAPEHRLPAAYDDGVNVVSWLVKQQLSNGGYSWVSKCNLANVFLAGDSAGANIAYQVAVRITAGGKLVNTLNLKGIILIHPFFGGESRTSSEKQQHHSKSSSALTLSASDTYWRLALPRGANRDHPWCNPLVSSMGFLREAKLPSTMVFMAEFDILKDRNLEMCKVMRSHGKRVEGIVHGGVGHAFHILDNSSLSRDRIHDMMCRLHRFIHPL